MTADEALVGVDLLARRYGLGGQAGERLARPGTHDIPLTWLHGWETVPARGQRVTITGIAMMTSPRKGSYRTNISVTALTIHDPVDPS